MQIYYLVGMPSSGKSTVGRELAQQLQLPFEDLDAWIERAEGRTIPEVFRDSGESYFREVEARVLREATHAASRQVIATGGGAPIFHDNMDFMNAHGVTVFLNVGVEELGRRLQATNVADRPLVQALEQGDFLTALAEKQKKRLPYYRQARVQVYDDALALPKLLEALREGGFLRN
ncbi:MAG TPA: shikimate kinase [Cytophagales bacterium]|nr:shikimate kinase [Cytophagales bacterium]